MPSGLCQCDFETTSATSNWWSSRDLDGQPKPVGTATACFVRWRDGVPEHGCGYYRADSTERAFAYNLIYPQKRVDPVEWCGFRFRKGFLMRTKPRCIYCNEILPITPNDFHNLHQDESIHYHCPYCRGGTVEKPRLQKVTRIIRFVSAFIR